MLPKPMIKLALKVVGFLLFGGIFTCAAASIFLMSTGWITPWEMFPSLPEPPQVDTGGLPIDTGDRSFELPPIPEDLQPGESVPLREKVERRPLTSEIPTPQQISTAPPVILTNVGLTALMAIIITTCTTLLDNMLIDERHRINTWLRAYGVNKIIPKVQQASQWSANRAIKQGCLTLPLVVFIIALYGIIFAFLEEGTSIFSPQGASLAIMMAFAVGIVSFSGDFVRRLLGRIWGNKSSFNIYPFGLVIAMLTVGISRIFNITPGIAFGVPGGAEVDLPPGEEERRENIIAFVSFAVLIAIVVGAWVISGVTLRVINTPIEERVATAIAGVVSLMQNGSLILFMIALETLFFDALPLAYASGRSLFKWSKPLWVALFVPVAFAFNHVLLNPQSEFLSSFTEANIRMLWFLLLGLVGFTSALWFYFNVVDDILQSWVGLRR